MGKDKILVVDDSQDSLHLIKHLLIKSGFKNITLARSAEEALGHLHKSIDECPFDLILLDIIMPGCDGIEACSLIKEHEQLTDIPIIMVTGVKEVHVLDKAFQSGAMDYVTKPFNYLELKARIHSALRLKNEMDKRKEREAELIKVTEELKQVNEQLLRLSMIDGLTEIPNRRRFDEVLKSEWSRSYRNGTPLSIVLLDIDQFKLYNDAYGHLQGDECLKQLASIIEKTLKRSTDIAARYGGEEFAVILPETDVNGAKAIAEQIRNNIENAKIAHRSSSVKNVVTISAGVASLCPKNSNFTLTEFIDLADKQLYEAKNNGRNQVKAALDERNERSPAS